MQSLELYYIDECPFCQKVLRYIKENNLDIPLTNTMTDDNNRIKLIEIGGKSQVPCLIIDGKPLYESDAILEWFENNR